MLHKGQFEIKISIPDSVVGKVSMSDVRSKYSASGTLSGYEVDLSFPEINKSKTIKSKDPLVLSGKVSELLNGWGTLYEKHLELKIKENRSLKTDAMNEEVKSVFEILDNLLASSLGDDHGVDWESLRRTEQFSIEPKELFGSRTWPQWISYSKYGEPTKVLQLQPPAEPSFEIVKSRFNWVNRIFRKSLIEKEYESEVDNYVRKTKKVQLYTAS